MAKLHRYHDVLIVPLWNWNACWLNRFFWAGAVLIVPLWNWNACWLNRFFWAGAVLIVPLWNWNRATSKADGFADSFNRTFMELKCRSIQSMSNIRISFNRTFMELKWSQGNTLRLAFLVLIVPLWNWNTYI